MGYEEFFPLFPKLEWEMEKCPEADVFFEEARIWIPEEMVQWLEMVLNGDSDKVNLHECEIVADVIDFEKRIKAELEMLRNNKSCTTILPSGFIRENNPLKREEKLLRLRWEFIEEQKAPENDWGLGAVFMYMMQLRILNRRSSFIPDEGEKTFHKLCEIARQEEA